MLAAMNSSFGVFNSDLKYLHEFQGSVQAKMMRAALSCNHDPAKTKQNKA